jgi:hypothetical protein
MRMSNRFCEGLRCYSARGARRVLEQIGEYAASRKSTYTQADVPRLMKEVRREKPSRVARPSR